MIKGLSIIAAIAMLMLTADIRAQVVTVDDPTGGVAPEAIYCPSTGGCFTSLKAAEDAMMAATPLLGQYLRYSWTSQQREGAYRYYSVAKQPPMVFYPWGYGVYNGHPSSFNYCPDEAIGLTPDSTYRYHCGSEQALFNGYVESVVRPGVRISSGTGTFVNSNPRMSGSYAEPFGTAEGGGGGVGALREDIGGGIPSDRKIVWDSDYTHGSVTTRQVKYVSVVRTGRYQCAQGLDALGTKSVDEFPLLCGKPSFRTYISILKSRQTDSCASGNGSCYPSSGDNSVTEVDLRFAGWDIARSYHSLREVAPLYSSLGNGWSFNIHAEVNIGAWKLISPSGNISNIQYFGGNYVVPGYGDSLLEKLPNNGWKLTEQDGVVSEFTSQGKLVGKSDLRDPSRTIQLSYERSSDGNQRPYRVTDASGRAMQFLYGPNDVITGIELPDGRRISYAYDASGNLISVDYGNGEIKQYHYGEQGLATNGDIGLLTGVTGEDGQRRADFGYDLYGRVVLSALRGSDDRSVQVARVHYSGLNSAQLVTDASGIGTYTFTGDKYRRPLAYTSSVSSVSSTYDSYGRALTRTNANGSQSRYTYTNGKLTSAISAFGTPDKRTQETTWHATLGLPTLQRTLNAAGQVVAQTNLDYSAAGQLLTTTAVDPATSIARTTTRAYCEQIDVDSGTCPRVGLLKSVDGPRTDVADTTVYAYYGTIGAACTSAVSGCGYRPGDLWKVTDALGRVTEVLAYDAMGRPLAVKDPNGVVTETLYHPRGWIAATTTKGATAAEDRITLYDYWPTGRVKKITYPDGVSTSYEYDDAHRLVAIADNAGNRIEYTLDGAGNRIREDTKGAAGTLKRTLSRVYNQLGQMATQADAQSNPTDFTYDAGGNTKTVTDALGHVTSNDYDPLSRLKRTLQDVGGIGAETKFEYDANDNLTKVTDPKGLDTTYQYNGLGDLVQLSSPDTGVTTYTYDSAGNRASQTDARGVTTTYHYDALNRLTQVGYPTPGLNVSYTYDVVQPVCQAGETFSVGRLTLMVDGSGSTQYCHDRFGQLVRKVQTTNGVALALQYAYTQSGQLRAVTYPDGTVADYVRNAQGQITGVGVTRPGQSREILLHQATYHPFGPVAGWVYGNGRPMQRNVDLDYRPTSIHGGTGGLELAYGYDAVGNLTSLTSGSPPPMAYRYDGLGRLTESRDGPTQAIIDKYEYDKTGNRTGYTDSLGTKAYAYPSNSHRLTSVAGENRTYDAVGNTLSIGAARAFDYSDAGRMSRVRNGGVVAMEYAYNGRGEQVRKHAGASNTYALYDESGHWLGDYGNAGHPIQQAIWMDDAPIGLLANGGQVHYVQPDHLGTPRAVIDPVRDMAVWTWDLKGEAFGTTLPEQDADGDGVSFALDMRFPGQQYDAASGLNYNYYRDGYDAGAGRYTQSDPIGLNGGISTFAYTGGAPLSFIDPLGLACRIVTKTSWTNSYENHRLVGDPLRITWPILGFSYSPGTTDFMPDPGMLIKNRLWFNPPISPKIIGYGFIYRQKVIRERLYKAIDHIYEICVDNCGRTTIAHVKDLPEYVLHRDYIGEYHTWWRSGMNAIDDLKNIGVE